MAGNTIIQAVAVPLSQLAGLIPTQNINVGTMQITPADTGVPNTVNNEFARRLSKDGIATAVAGATVTATGATAARTMPVRFSDVLNVKDFGAIGDGTTDDTLAIQNAFNAVCMSAHNLEVPSGTYLVSNLILPYNSAYDSDPPPWDQSMPRIFGHPGATIKKMSSADNSYLVASSRWATNTPYNNTPVWIENIVFDGAGIAQDVFVSIAFSSRVDECVFRGAVRHGVYEPVTTQNGTALNGARSTSRYSRNKFINNGDHGFYVAPFGSGIAYVTDYWFDQNIIYNNGRANAYIGQHAGWLITGNHAYWSGVTPTGALGYSVFLGGGINSVISGNVWEGTPNYFGLQIGGDGSPITIEGDQFILGKGCFATFATSSTYTHLIRIRHCKFATGTFLQHGGDDATCELLSESNTFADASYTFSAGAAHRGILRSFNDRVETDQHVYTGQQTFYHTGTVAQPGVSYPVSLPYQITTTDLATIRVTNPLTSSSYVMLPATAKTSGCIYRVVRATTATGAFTLSVKNPAGVSVVDMASAGQYADVQCDGVAWICTAYGASL